MADYGSTSEPGIVTNVDSALTISTSGDAPANVGIVGQADLTVGTANPNEVYEVTRASSARTWFGEESLLAKAVVDALDQGAYPVYAVATAETQVTSEDLSGVSSTSVSLANSPVSEDAADTTLTIDGNDITVNVGLDAAPDQSPAAGEAFLNPVDAELELESIPSDADTSNDTVDYLTYDYESALDALAANAGGAVDFVVPLNENDAVVTYAQTTVNNMDDEYNFALCLAGAGTHVDSSTYTNPYDDSRMLLVYPSRNAAGESVLGSYAGLRARLGIRTTPINKRLDNQTDLAVSLNKSSRGSLIDARVVPLADDVGGARIADDVNTVSDDNTDEAGIRYGFSRLVFDYAITVVRVNERPFIGRLNDPEVRDALEGLLNSQLRSLTRSNAITSFEAEVFEKNATSAAVELQMVGAEPIRFIDNTVTIGN